MTTDTVAAASAAPAGAAAAAAPAAAAAAPPAASSLMLPSSSPSSSHYSNAPSAAALALASDASTVMAALRAQAAAKWQAGRYSSVSSLFFSSSSRGIRFFVLFEIDRWFPSIECIFLPPGPFLFFCFPEASSDQARRFGPSETKNAERIKREKMP